MTTFLAPFFIGLAGSLHCIGMCSPLVMAATRSGKGAILRNLQYNLGRILTYGLLGAAISLAGRGLDLMGVQQWVSIGAGVTLLIVGATSIRVATPGFAQAATIKVMNSLKKLFSRAISTSNGFGIVLLGMINGLLPCGLTLVALGYCLTLAGPVDGFVAMTFFGLGTLPAMVGVASIVRSIVTRTKIGYTTIQATLIIISGMLLIGRGVADFDSLANHSGSTPGIVICGGKIDAERIEMLP